jgi:glycosyltransferase involved in cell wall biosynthesis
MGGISSVVNVYRSAGLFQRYPIYYLATHCDGEAGAKLRLMMRAMLQFIWLLLQNKVGLVHIHMSSRASFWRKSFFVVVAFLRGVPTIIHLHGSEFAVFYDMECGNGTKWFVRFVFNRATKVIVLSHTWKIWVCGMCTNANVDVIYNPVVFPLEQTAWDQRKKGAVLFLGRLGKRKGCYDLLDAATMISARSSDFALLFGGDGEIKEIEARAAALGLSGKVKTLGWVKGSDKERSLSSAKIYALPSYNEGLPMSVLEAMAAGLPILSTLVGGIPEAVSDGIEGFLVEPGDINSLAERLEYLLLNDDLARKMGQAAREKVKQKFSTDAILPQIERIYDHFGFKAI